MNNEIKNVQIPEEVHAKLKVLAAKEGMMLKHKVRIILENALKRKWSATNVKNQKQQ